MKKMVGLMLLAVIALWGCAETNSRSDTMRDASLCAMCGASVSGDYFVNTTLRSTGPTNR